MLAGKFGGGALAASIALHGAVLGIVLLTHSQTLPKAGTADALAVDLVAEQPQAAAPTAVAAAEPASAPAALLPPAPPAPVAAAEPQPSPPLLTQPRAMARATKEAVHRIEKRHGTAASPTVVAIAEIPPPALAQSQATAPGPEPPTPDAPAAANAVVASPAVPAAAAHPDVAVPGGPAGAAPEGASQAANPDYLRAVLAWLERHKTYPEEARMKRQQGTVLIAFSIDRGGHIVSFAIRKSSGFAVLDAAAKDMVDQADPVPPMPASYGRERLALTLPVEFALR